MGRIGCNIGEDESEWASDAKVLALATIRRPVSYDKTGQWIRDSGGEKVCEIRGWGRIGYLDHPEARQDAIGEFIARLINEAK